MHLGIDGGRGLPIEPVYQVAELVAHHLVPACDHIHHRLYTDDLGGRGDQGRGPRILPRPRDLRIHLVQTVEGVHLLELADQIRDHPAGDLVGQNTCVDQGEFVRRQMFLVFGGDLLEMFPQIDQFADVQARIPFRPLEGDDERFDGGHRSPKGIGSETGVHDVDAGFDRLEVGHGGHAAGVVGMEVQGDPGDFFQFCDQVINVVRGYDPGHVLDADAVGTHRLQ